LGLAEPPFNAFAQAPADAEQGRADCLRRSPLPAGDLLWRMSFAIAQLEKMLCVTLYAIEAMLKRVALGRPHVGVLGKGIGDILQHIVSHDQLPTAFSAEMVGDFMAGNADGPRRKVFTRGREGMAIEERDGNILKNVLGVGAIPYRRRNERVNNGLCKDPCTGNGFAVGYGHGHFLARLGMSHL
jgi:hypothetical protein